jgi:hypothetical protein
MYRGSSAGYSRGPVPNVKDVTTWPPLILPSVSPSEISWLELELTSIEEDFEAPTREKYLSKFDPLNIVDYC